MKHTQRNIALTLLALLILTFVASCSDKGIRMPKHRKRRHCNCPTFSQAAPSPNPLLAYYDPARD